MNVNLRILCISPYFVPLADPEAFCGAKLANSLIHNGLDIEIIYMENSKRRHDSSSVWMDLKNASYCVKEPEERNISHSIISGIKYGTTKSATRVAAAIKMATDMHEKKPFDVIYSRSLPMYSHVAGYWCSQRLKLPWIVNINDTWDVHLAPIEYDEKVSIVYKAISRIWLKKTINRAAMVMYPSSRLRDFHIRLTNIDHKNAIVPHIGYANNEQKDDIKKFRLVHAGLISAKSSLRNPKVFLNGLRLFLDNNPGAMKMTEMVFVGTKDQSTIDLSSMLGLEDIIKYTGVINYEDSLKQVGSASLCVLIEAVMEEGLFLPSKMADYIVARKPVLSLSPATGTINDMLPERGIIRINQDDTSGVANALAEYYKHYCNESLNEKTPSDALVSQFMPDTVVNIFLSAVDAIIKNEKK
jgi:glycosyltransferase involved in cell wall biosynthesis